MPRVLIVAYGNPLRSDDGLAWRAADELEGKFLESDVEILRLHQLAPELAEAVSRFKAVIFVDAAAAGTRPAGEVRCEEILLSARESRFSHHLSADAVVALARQLYGATARAFSVTSSGQCFDHGESLSPAVADGLPLLVAQIESLVRGFLSETSPG